MNGRFKTLGEIIETIQRDAKKQQGTLGRYRRDLGVLADLVPRGPTEGVTNRLGFLDGHLEECRNLCV